MPEELISTHTNGQIEFIDMIKVKYDKEVDMLFIRLTENPIKESDEEKPGIILNYSADGSIVSIEILDVSKKMPYPYKVEYEVA